MSKKSTLTLALSLLPLAFLVYLVPLPAFAPPMTPLFLSAACIFGAMFLLGRHSDLVRRQEREIEEKTKEWTDKVMQSSGAERHPGIRGAVEKTMREAVEREVTGRKPDDV